MTLIARSACAPVKEGSDEIAVTAVWPVMFVIIWRTSCEAGSHIDIIGAIQPGRQLSPPAVARGTVGVDLRQIGKQFDLCRLVRDLPCLSQGRLRNSTRTFAVLRGGQQDDNAVQQSKEVDVRRCGKHRIGHCKDRRKESCHLRKQFTATAIHDHSRGNRVLSRRTQCVSSRAVSQAIFPKPRCPGKSICEKTGYRSRQPRSGPAVFRGGAARSAGR